MSGALLLAPHNDDEALFAAYHCLRHRPRVVVCYRSYIQDQYGVSYEEREQETAAAMEILGCSWRQFFEPDLNNPPRTTGLGRFFEELSLVGWDLVFAPAVEEEGHAQHSYIGELADEFFGPERVVHYLTYTRHGGRSRDGELVEPDEPEWVSLKERALACYRSQLRVPNCRSWFEDPDLREWIA